MAKLYYVDHTTEDPVQTFLDFRNTCSYKTGYIGSGGVSIDPDDCHSICGEIYARFQQGAEMYGLPLIHLVLTFSEEEASTISEEELSNLTDLIAQCCVPQLLYHATYKTDEGAEIHFLLNPLDYTMTLCCDLDLLYLTFMNCIMCLFHHPELWKGHIGLRDIYSNYSYNSMSGDFLKPLQTMKDI